jgi:hypothetical protein
MSLGVVIYPAVDPELVRPAAKHVVRSVLLLGIRLARSTGLSNNGTASGDSELKTAGFAGGHQAALGSCGHSGTIREQTVC